VTATLRQAPAPPRASTTATTPAGVRPAGGNAGGVGNLALLLLTLAAVFGVARLFTRPAHFFVPVAVVAAGVHVTAWACRKTNLTVLPAAFACAVVAALTMSWLALGHTTAYGLPWRGTWHALGPALRAAADAYRTTAAPTGVIPGFVLAGAFGAAAAAFLSDWAAFRMRATTEAVLPSFSLFVLSAALAQGHEVVGAGAMWLGALLIFLLVRQAAVDSPATAWFASRSRRGPTTILAVGGLMTVATVLLAAEIAPHLPGATTHALVNWRHSGNDGSGGRNAASPLVDLATRLRQLSQEEVFTVQTTQPSYLRITALSTFSGSGWSLDDTYRPAHGDLPSADSGPTALPADVGPAKTVTATVHVTALQSLWLPAVYRPVRLSGVGGVSYSAEAGSLITSKPTSDGMSYTVTSRVATPTPAQLHASRWVDTGRVDLRKYLELPVSVPSVVKQLAQEHIQNATDPFTAARMLQDWLRGPPFTYDLNVPADQSQNALVDFLTKTRAGFCQQFAASYAVLAREVGLPSRVAVGFTEGDVDSQGIYHVKDADAHAWPEVWFDGIGWVAFEPTPGRGSPDPNAEAVTGAAPAQAASGTTPTTQPTPTTVAPGTPTTAPRRARTPADGGSAVAPVTHRRWWRTPALVAVGVAAAAALAWVLALTAIASAAGRRRRRLARSPAAQVTLAWSLAGEALAGAGVPPHPWETPAEFAARVAAGTRLPEAAGAAVRRLAAIEERAVYSPAVPTPDDVDTAAAAAAEIAAAARARRGTWRELGRRWDPRPVVAAVLATRAEARAAHGEPGAAPAPQEAQEPRELEELSPRG